MQSTSSQIPRMYHNHMQVQCLGFSFIKWSSCTKMPAFLTLIFLGYDEASLGFIIFSHSRSWVCLKSDTGSKIRRQYLPRWGELPRCESMCECTAHLFFTRSVGGHTQRAPGAKLLPALHGGAIWHFPPALGYSCHAVGDIHTSADCAPTSPQVCRVKHRNVCLDICSGAEQMQVCETWQVRPLKNVVLSAGAPTQVVSASKTARGFVWAHISHAGKLSVKFLELHCATFMQVKEEKSTSCTPLTY